MKSHRLTGSALLGACAWMAINVSAWVPAVAFAQATAATASSSPLPSVPTTRILAIGKLTAAGTVAARRDLLSAEVRDTVRLYLGGKIDQWFVRQDQGGVVFLLNLTDLKEAHDLLEGLPLGRAGLMEFELIPLGPLSPLSVLLSPIAAPVP